jgi:3-isopropylmalate/(R)-2-methylmalate dehydratase large subunit
MGMTIAEKILAQHSGQREVGPGDVVVVEVDVILDLDLGFIIQGLHPMPTRVAAPEKIVIVPDHFMPAPSTEAANGLKRMRQFAEKFGIENFFPEGNHGIGHVVVAERGFALPGKILACSDSHTCSAGAINCLARGLGGAEMMYVICKGQTWYMLGPTTKVVLEGELPERVYPRDVIHYLGGEYGDFANRNLEWHGEGVHSMAMPGRLTITTMSAEVSAEFSIFPYDAVTEAYLDGRAQSSFEPAAPDPDARYEETITIDLGALDPQVVLPGRVPHNVVGIGEVAGIRIDQAFVGSCANGRLEDIALVAEMLKGRQIASGTRFIVTPGSQNIFKEAVKAGYVETLLEAGVLFTNSTCGLCYGGHMGLLADGEVCFTSSTRNFKGRMGSTAAEIYMGSPAAVTASAIKGVITDPRDL